VDGPGIESRWEGEIFRTVQTGPGVHPASYTMRTGLIRGEKRVGCGVNHPPPSSAEVKERVELYLYSPSLVFMAGYNVNFTLYLYTLAANFTNDGLFSQFIPSEDHFSTTTRRKSDEAKVMRNYHTGVYDEIRRRNLMQ
jgi:hypothetical protein